MQANVKLIAILEEVRDLIVDEDMEFMWFDSSRCAVGCIIQIVCRISDYDLAQILYRESNYAYTITWHDLIEAYSINKCSQRIRDLFEKLHHIGISNADIINIENMNLYGSQLAEDVSRDGYINFLNSTILDMEAALCN